MEKRNWSLGFRVEMEKQATVESSLLRLNGKLRAWYLGCHCGGGKSRGLGDLTYTASLFLSYPTKKVRSYRRTFPKVLNPQASVPKSFTGCRVTVDLGECI